ncbi:hypothetical protein FBZ93_11964 [Bradyrhizobium macuxiense]|uniref:Uncharacterized protein n=1 Tax=Bradyrhizobium macuxiense TaxID=1755647 RepID=A0A560L107_9BRAD|nr:hypothetical protein FBZ93_11964 [Bradyrhizobium macuxiense]
MWWTAATAPPDRLENSEPSGRDRGCMTNSRPQTRCRPGQAKRDPGSITTKANWFARWSHSAFQQLKLVVMGPCSRAQLRTRQGTTRGKSRGLTHWIARSSRAMTLSKLFDRSNQKPRIEADLIGPPSASWPKSRARVGGRVPRALRSRTSAPVPATAQPRPGFAGNGGGSRLAVWPVGQSRENPCHHSVTGAGMPRLESRRQSKRIQRASFGRFVVHLTLI